jgi:predicted transcriptional regulator/5-methylcytosine-specific restriction endonuclease McrA
MKDLRKFDCRYCGNKFIPQDSSASHIARNIPKYCTKKCRNNARRSRVIVACSNPNCKKLIEKVPCELKRHPCCDIYCASQWKMATRFSAGENNPAWRGGISYGFRGENWDEQRQKALERDKYTCQRCSLSRREIQQKKLLGLDVHHIRPYHLFSHYVEANKLENLKTLCRICHMIEEHQFIKAHPKEPQLRRIPKTEPAQRPCIKCHKVFQPLKHSDKACDKCMTFRCINCRKDHRVKEYHMIKFQQFCSAECVTKYIGRNNRKIDLAIVEKMKRLRDLQLTFREIAAKVGFSKYAVRTNLIKKYGYDAVKHPSTHVNQALLGKMKALSLQGYSTRKIAAELRIGKSTAARYLKKPIQPFIIHRGGFVGKVDQVMLERVKALRNKGFSYRKIASIVGLCRQTVKIHLKSYEPSITFSHPSRKMTQVMIEKARILRNEGLSYEKIGSELGVVGKTIWKYLKSYRPTPVVLVKESIKSLPV